MKTKFKYSYSILRYVHDIATSEFLNVGIAVFSSEQRFFKVICRKNLGRLADAFPDINKAAFKSVMKELTDQFAAVAEQVSESVEISDLNQELDVLLTSVLPQDDSSLVWTPSSPGISADLEQVARNIFKRYVAKYDTESLKHKKTDEDVWRKFHRGLVARNISSYFKEKTVTGDVDEMKFKSAWKNGIWHCIEPISFDLSGPDGIKDKAQKFLGQIASISEALRGHKIYFVLGSPKDHHLDSAMTNAAAILSKLPIENEIFFDSNESALLDELKRKIDIHEQNSSLPH